ncbi:NYN domain-containing protein [Kitasatospora sp. NPDC048540]|uniref:NYN domain-containing protein n=1 Tax=Kitasatospora sp. NPDC048540 TaxID=3155634 RepID=UPI0034074B84
MADRVIVFFDYQNVYGGARRQFHSHWEPPECGHVDPVALAHHIAKDSPYDRELTQIRIYRGQPDSTKQPGSYGASRRQHAVWQRDPLVHLVTRPLRYPQNWPAERAQEKGIDVQLALDFAGLAFQGLYDVGIMMSADTDLKPALEYVVGLSPNNRKPRAEVAAWSAKGQHSPRLSIPGASLYCHWVGEDVYKRVKDTTEYTKTT